MCLEVDIVPTYIIMNEANELMQLPATMERRLREEELAKQKAAPITTPTPTSAVSRIDLITEAFRQQLSTIPEEVFRTEDIQGVVGRFFN